MLHNSTLLYNGGHILKVQQLDTLTTLEPPLMFDFHFLWQILKTPSENQWCSTF